MGRPTNHRPPPAAERADAARGIPARRLDRLAEDLEDHGWQVVRRRRGASEVWRVSSAALGRRQPGETRRRRVHEVAAMVKITHLLDKLPSQCSGG